MARFTSLVLLVACLGCHRATTPKLEEAPPPRPVAPGLAGGVDYLLKHQSDDGAWRSDVYATFKDGTALTPLVLTALQDAADFTESKAARRKASEWLAKRVKADGTIDEGPEGLPYPVYTAALSVTALSHPDNRDLLRQRDAWLKYLLDRQLTEQNGWSPEDKQYGGWGYFPGIPRKPKPGEAVPGQQLLETNISATAFAVDALWAARHTNASNWIGVRVLLSLKRLQNEDGGFRLVSDDPVRNKAGSASRNADGVPVFHSYGSATADGARISWLELKTNGVQAETARLEKLKTGSKVLDPPGRSFPFALEATQWLDKHFRADRHPGTYIEAHERTRNAVYFYYARSVAKTLRLVGLREVGDCHWPLSLSDELLARQLPDGSWSNPLDQQRENDPVLATAYAVSALGECRKARTR